MPKQKTYLYLYWSEARQAIYVGIGSSVRRVWEGHNPDAERLREDRAMAILQTPEPFDSCEDALKAEAIAIHIASLKGLEVVEGDRQEISEEEADELRRLRTTNHAGTVAGKWLAPAVLRREGEARADALRGKAVVVIAPDQIEERPTPGAGRSGAAFSERAAKWWNVSAERRTYVSGLIAILKGSRGVILGSWRVDPGGEWADEQGRGVIPLLDPDHDDYEGLKGKRLVRLAGNSGVVYSPDPRELTT